MYLGGEASGGAAADLLMGKADPGGRLAESWPFTEADAPSHGNFPGYPQTVEYREGLFVGYRYYETAHKAVRHPFGFGLAYTQFEYSGLKLSAEKMKDTDTLTVTCTVRNTGKRPGSEVIQLYVACQGSVIIRAAQELKGFEKITLAPGESREVSFSLSRRDFAYYNVSIADWHVESADYEVRLGAASNDIRLRAVVHVESTLAAPMPDLRQATPSYYNLSGGVNVPDGEFTALLGRPIPARQREPGSPHTISSTMTEIQDRLLGRWLMGSMKKQIEKFGKTNPDLKMMGEKMLPDMPLRFLMVMSNGGFTGNQVLGLVEMLNGHYLAGLRLMRKKVAK